MACKGARCDYYPGGQWWTSFPPSQLAPSWVTQFSPEKLLTLIGLFSKYDWLSVIFTPVHCAKKIEREGNKIDQSLDEIDNDHTVVI